MIPIEKISDEELDQHYCLESVDILPSDPETTAFKRKARLHQALWRERNGLEIGTQPMKPAEDEKFRLLGSRINLAYARQTGANFLSNEVQRAVNHRLSHREPHQMLNEDRLFCDLLSSMPMCFNLFGYLRDDLDLATRAVKRWWPDVSGQVSAVHFEWSPGRRDAEYLGNRSAFDVAFEVALNDSRFGIVGVETKYHEHCKSGNEPKKNRRERYETVMISSGVFKPEAVNAVLGTDLQQIWLDHLLALSMLQHPSKKWCWVKFVLVYPDKNPSFNNAVSRYRKLLNDSTTFDVRTIESLIDAQVLPLETAEAFRERYIW